ncbi:MAG: hypothetical protein K2N43_00015 [Lachnospiraceae bacterium]|nr:hypothetical protein [Lachnospiraceae bacterium]
MNRGFGMITALLVLTIAFCVSGTVMSRERDDNTQENERYAALEADFLARTRAILEDAGYHDSGVTLTWTREGGGVRSYLVEIHHRGIGYLGDDEREQLTESLCGGELGKEAEALLVVYS